MKVVLLNENRLSFLDLPNVIEGSFWITDTKDTEQKLINIESRGNQWFLVSNQFNWIISQNGPIAEQPIVENNFYIYGNEKQKHMIYITNNYDHFMGLYQVNSNIDVLIGNDAKCGICYQTTMINSSYAQLSMKNGVWSINIAEQAYVYVNNGRLSKHANLQNGDTIFIMGLLITVVGKLILINNPNGLVKVQIPNLSLVSIPKQEYEYEEVKEMDYYNDEDYFFKTPRLRRFITTYKLKIAPPPAPEKQEELPLILMLGPMLTMGMTSAVSLLNVLLRLSNGTATFANSWTTLVVAIAMMTTTLLWPNLTKKYKKKRAKEKEELRRNKYGDYLEEKRKLLEAEKITQSQILNENLLELKECYDIIKNRRRVLWERKITQQDFLTVRVGVGDVPLDAEINFNEDEFILEEDDVKHAAENLVHSFKIINSSPVGYSFYNKKVTAIMGIETKIKDFVDNVLLQLITFHSYDDLKIVVFTSESNISDWEYIKKLPHCFSNDKSIRFFATNDEEEKMVSHYLEQEFIKRVESNAAKEQVENESEDNTYLPYYLILTDNYLGIRKLGISEKIMNSKENYGFGFIIKETRLGKLPSECETFINLGPSSSTILSTSLDNSYQQNFNDEITNIYSMHECASILANIPIEFEFDYRNLPTSLSFLDMYSVGKIDQLNTLNRWRLNDSTKSLKATIGVDDLENKIYLDLHEKAHGPHGLIAGTTGSGKSEFIITYILSMALNYSPNEVAFILIDYKGGGLAGAFENKKNNVRLPHLAGTITNLDKNELNRTLVSIDSELKRRQQKFNDARDELGESTMDIYKYQKFFREKKLSEPIPHLFIICDEFAELKSQQPEFMDNLISAARIGRSLGVHLILATQKPSGVVNDQIWSNTKFRVCLKVQDKADSNEMIKCPNAAEITNAGRFYLQVGYNEIFVLGQSGWAGSPYIPKNLATKEVDRSLVFIDNVADVTKVVESDSNKVRQESKGDELSNILKYITAIAMREDIHARTLWLENIPDKIYVKDLLPKYQVKVNPNDVTAIIGEYDDPSSQRQDILSLKMDADGNTIVYGLAGIGREMLLKSIIYSCSTLYSTNDINFYIFDFGSESLRVFSKLPHVGDIVFSNETEKLEKLFKIIDREIEKRKELFSEYNGDYATYCKSSGNKLPIYTVIINNYDSFKESYLNYEELVIKIAREGKRYGVIMIITASTASGMYSKLVRNFNHVFVLDMNDKNDYTNILGKIGNVYPSDFPGRGLFKEELAYEFQTASICEDELLIEHIKVVSQELEKRNPYKPTSVPVLPEKISLSMIENPDDDVKSMPLGLIRDDLSTYRYNLKQDKATIISANEIESCIRITKSILSVLTRNENMISIVLDTEGTFEAIRGDRVNYYDTDYSSVLETVMKYIDEKMPNTQRELVFFLIGLEKFKAEVLSTDITKFFDKIKQSKNVSVVFIESAFRLKKFAFEGWYSSLVMNTNGIWIGSGVMEQPVIKLADMNKKYKEKITEEYAWIFKNSNATLVKLVNDDGDAHEE